MVSTLLAGEMEVSSPLNKPREELRVGYDRGRSPHGGLCNSFNVSVVWVHGYGERWPRGPSVLYGEENSHS